jgi:hypothetical protein
MRVASFRVMTNLQALEHVPLAYRIIKMHEWTEDSSLVELERMGVLQMREWERDMRRFLEWRPCPGGGD